MSYGSPQVYVPNLSRVNKFIIIVSGALLLLQGFCEGFLKFPLSSYLGLSGAMIAKGHVYQLVTFFLSPTQLLNYIFSALIIWFIGSDIEEGLGRQQYIKFLLSAVLGASFVYLALIFTVFSDTIAFVGPPLVGLSCLCYSLLLLYGHLYGDRVLNFMLIFPMKAKVFCWILIAIELYMGFFSANSRSSWGHLGGMGLSYLYYRYGRELQFGFSGGSKKSSMGKRKKNHLRLVSSEEDDKDDGSGDSGSGPRYLQ